MRHIPLVLCLFSFATSAVQAQTGTQPQPIELAEGGVIEGALTADSDTLEGGRFVAEHALEVRESGPFEVRLTSGDFDPLLILVSPTGAESENDDFEGSESESAVLIEGEDETDGRWTVRVAASSLNEVGPYRLEHRVLTPEEATPAAERQRRLAQADSLEKQTQELIRTGRYGNAIPIARELLEIREAVLGSEHPIVAVSLSTLGWALEHQGDYEAAQSAYERALGINEVALEPGHPELATNRTNLAYALIGQADYAAARPLLEEGIAILEGVQGPPHPGIASSLIGLADLLRIQQDYTSARPLYERALAINEAALGPEHPEVAINLNNLAVLLFTQGDYTAARPLYERALAINEAALGPEHPEVAQSLDVLGTLFMAQGDFAAVRPLYERALAIREARLGSEHPEVANTLENLGSLFFKQGDPEEAQPFYERALAIREERLGPVHPRVAGSLHNLAHTFRAQGNFEAALPLYELALTINEGVRGPSHFVVAMNLSALAGLSLDQGRYEDALIFIDRAIDIFDSTPAFPQSRINAYTTRSQILKAKGDDQGALLNLEEALYAIEMLRPKVGGGEETRAAFLSGYADAFDLMIQWQLEAGDAEAAFAYAERSRARAFLDQLAAGQVDLRASIPADVREELEARETDARARLAEFQQRITFTRSRKDLADEERLATIAALEDSLRTADRDYAAVYADIKAASPLWRSYVTAGGEPVRLAEAQRSLVPEGGLILLYQLSGEASHLFVVPPRGGRVEAVPLEVPEGVAAALGVEAGLLTAERLGRALAVGDGGADGLGLRTRGVEADEGSHSAERLHALWRVLVPEPVWERVAEATEVIVIPDGPLNHLPFEALVTQPEATPDLTRYWLDDGPPVRYAPSVTALYNIARRPAPRVVAQAGAPSVLSLSAPLYDPDEVALAEASGSAPEGGALEEGGIAALVPRTRDAYDRAGGVLVPLPGTARETEAIRSALGAEADRSLFALQGLGATETALRAAIPGKRHVHLATHGLVEEGRGALFAALALTPPSSLTRDLADDGFLQLHEVYGLDLAETELAVLSACETAVGEDVAGEGAFALSRGFLAAGARRVVASQWAVDDASTAALMGAFFEAVLEAERAGRAPDVSRALFEAKRAVRAEAAWAEPYFWAPFVLAGL